LVWLWASWACAHGGASGEYLVYFGTYTSAKSHGIYVSRFASGTGRLSAAELAAETPHPSFLAVHPSRRFLYAVGEIAGREGRRAGGVNAFALDRRTGRLAALNQQPSGGLGPCHVEVDKTGRCLLVANYGSGSVAALPIGKDGRLGAPVCTRQHTGSSVHPQRQAGPHAHCVNVNPANRFALVCDLGLDRVLVYRLDPKHGTLLPNDPPSAAVRPGAGPRHLAFRRDGRFVFVVNELASTLSAFAFDPRRGALAEVETVSTLPAGFAGTNNTCAEVAVHPNGRFVYASNRGHDSIVTFAVDPASGRLGYVAHQATGGRTPRHFALDPTGKWLLAENQASDSVVVFRLDTKSGRLLPTGQAVSVPSPVCAVFVPAR